MNSTLIPADMAITDMLCLPVFSLPSGELHPDAASVARQLCFVPYAELRAKLETLAARLDRVTITAMELINEPKYRQADGSLTDAAHSAYKTASESFPDGFIPDDELDHVSVTLA